jgi:hypothetical protein
MKKRHVWILLLFTLLCGVLIWWLLTSESSPFFRSAPDPIPATLTYLSGEAHRLTEGETEWKPIVIGEVIQPRDRIRTAENAQALISFSGEASLFLNSSSEAEFAGGIYLWNGELSYKRFNGSPRVPSVLSTSDGILTLGTRLPGDSDEAWLTRSIRGTHVAVDRGSAAWRPTQGSNRSMLQGDHIQFNSGSVMNLSTIIRSPEAGEHFTQGYMFRGFNIVWTPDSNAVSYRLEIARIDDGIPYIKWIDTETNGYRVRDLDEGSYSVRVWVQGRDGRRTMWSESVGLSVGGRYFDSIRQPLNWEEPVRFDVAPYRDNMLMGGYLRKDLIDTHEIVFYALTDAWWIQPQADHYRIQASEDGYFEVFCNSARSVYVMVVRKGEGEFPETAPRSRFFPFPDGRHILYHIEKPLRP